MGSTFATTVTVNLPRKARAVRALQKYNFSKSNVCWDPLSPMYAWDTKKTFIYFNTPLYGKAFPSRNLDLQSNSIVPILL